MSRRQSRLVDYGVYLAIRVLVCVVQALSWSASIGLARMLAGLAIRLDRRHRAVAIENLRHAFPDLSPDQVHCLTRATYRHFLTMLVEIIRLPRVLQTHNVDKYIEYASAAQFDQAMRCWSSGRPLMVLTGHFGNWEILSYVTGLLGFRGNVVARRLDNSYLDQFLRHFRKKTGQAILDKSQDYARIEKTLADGKHLGMLGDQDAGARGLFVDFLGRPASTFKSIALLSLTYSAPILVFGAARIREPMRYRLYLEDVIEPADYATIPDAPRAITQRYTDALERLIRRHPEQYFWLHRRWKHQPNVRKAKKAA